MSLQLQNSQLPIYRLPPELLTSIFLYARDLAGYRKRSRSALILSGVSSHWREVALSNPAIWTFLDIAGEDVVDALLTRSRGAKLTIDLWGDSPDDFIPILKELYRLESLTMFCPEIDIDEGDVMPDDTLLRPHWSQPAPYLRKLSINNFPIPPNPFNNASPALRKVELVWCAFDWDAFPFSNLTTLHIVCPDDLISPAHFLQKLQQMPLLEQLELEGVLLGTDGPGTGRLKLPHLSRMDIPLVDAGTLLDFLQRICIPATAHICVRPDDCGDMAPEIITELRACLDGESKKLRKFRLDAYTNALTVDAIPILPTPKDRNGHTPLLHGSFVDWQLDRSVADELFQYYDFSGLTELTLHSDEQELSHDVWTTTFTPLLQLAVLDLEGVFAISFINHFSRSARLISDLLPTDTTIEDAARGELRDKMIFPSLKKLLLNRKSPFGGGAEIDIDRKWPGEFGMFRFVLGMRWLIGCGIQELKVMRFWLSTQEIADLERTVDKLTYEKTWGLDTPVGNSEADSDSDDG
ncbi:hypothetical protein BDN72DRAFT_845865 [Pluteus cervinus]|uniref:Uncharacterized protein n=1 Tax=Pluteus cervinus TaxID=181527 RepID=A0ACD3AHU3_9AGAR|nr:hypothetical protein BDN72DRAFT_845865 [Pluteus cervinus]